MSDGENPASPDAGQAASEPENKPVDVGGADAVAVEEPAAPVDADAEAAEADDESQPDEAGEPRPRKRSSTERYRRKISYLAGDLERKNAEIEQLRQQVASKSEEAEPDPSKYDGGEFDAKYIRDLATHIAKSEVRKNAGTAPQAQVNPEMIAFQQEAKRFSPELEKKAAEFYEDGGRIPEHVASAIFSAENRPAVLNHLLDNPELADEISGMTPMQAAVKIGRLDAAFGKTPTRTVTKAPPPLKSPAGGTAPPQTPTDLAKSDDVSAYVALRRQQRTARA